MKRKNIFLAIGTQKGGAGKTSTTMLAASLITAKTDYKVAVVDVDPQQSLVNKRSREWDLLKGTKKEPPLALVKALTLLKRQGKTPYKVFDLTVSPSGGSDIEKEALVKDAFDKIAQLKTSDEFDFVFFDFPGYTANKEFLKVLFWMNYVLVPFYPDDNSLDSTMNYIRTLHEIKKTGKSSIVDIAVFMWKYSGAKNVSKFEAIVGALTKAEIKVFENKVFESTEIETNRSTIIPFDLDAKRSLMPFVNELISFVNK